MQCFAREPALKPQFGLVSSSRVFPLHFYSLCTFLPRTYRQNWRNWLTLCVYCFTRLFLYISVAWQPLEKNLKGRRWDRLSQWPLLCSALSYRCHVNATETCRLASLLYRMYSFSRPVSNYKKKRKICSYFPFFISFSSWSLLLFLRLPRCL